VGLLDATRNVEAHLRFAGPYESANSEVKFNSRLVQSRRLLMAEFRYLPLSIDGKLLLTFARSDDEDGQLKKS
jgi:hypothetical protein